MRNRIPRGARRAAVAVAGSMVVVVGLALLVLPGPGLLLLTAGLALLATEFAWAQRWLACIRECAAGRPTDPRSSSFN